MIEIVIVALSIGLSCALLGSFLVVQGESLMSDAISHSLLSGIVIAYIISGQMSFFILACGGLASSLVSIFIVYWLSQNALIKQDVAIGVVFSYFFSIGVVLISLYASSIHLDIDMVLLGDLVFVPFNRFYWNGVDIGSLSVFIATTSFLFNVMIIWFLYRHLLLIAFDRQYAQVSGVRLQVMMALGVVVTSFNLVVAFECVGIVASIGMLVVPPATALLTAVSMKDVIFKSLMVAVLGILIGLKIAFLIDISIAGSLVMAEVMLFGIQFLYVQVEKIIKRGSFNKLFLLPK
jgi:manganese/zinc/iron transport system permease protein